MERQWIEGDFVVFGFSSPIDLNALFREWNLTEDVLAIAVRACRAVCYSSRPL